VSGVQLYSKGKFRATSMRKLARITRLFDCYSRTDGYQSRHVVTIKTRTLLDGKVIWGRGQTKIIRSRETVCCL